MTSASKQESLCCIYTAVNNNTLSPFVLFSDFFTQVFKYKEYLKQSVTRDLRKKYKRSTLGYMWSMLQPLFTMAIMAVVFSALLRGGIENYAVFLFTGMIPWMYFDQTRGSSMNSIRSHSKILEQLDVPKYIFPTATALYALVNFFLIFIPLLLVMYVTDHSPTSMALMLPIVLVPLVLVTLGVSFLLAVANVFFEDTEHLCDVFFKALYYLCPILYSKDMLPEWLQQWVVLNPLFGIIEMTRNVLYYGTLPNLETWVFTTLAGIILLYLGLLAFRRNNHKFIYFV